MKPLALDRKEVTMLEVSDFAHWTLGVSRRKLRGHRFEAQVILSTQLNVSIGDESDLRLRKGGNQTETVVLTAKFLDNAGLRA